MPVNGVALGPGGSEADAAKTCTHTYTHTHIRNMCIAQSQMLVGGVALGPGGSEADAAGGTGHNRAPVPGSGNAASWENAPAFKQLLLKEHKRIRGVCVVRGVCLCVSECSERPCLQVAAAEGSFA
jgi:hypothetical protein